MDFFGLLTMIGGLALFLYGMKVMGDALSKMAGGRLEQVLERMTDNPVKAVLLGAGVTAVIQSSSATTVMVVGFVNSGIMKLSQAVSVIMGANIGTTVTSWILSLSGIESGNFFVKLLKPSSFSPVLALTGVILVMFVRNTKKNDVGTVLIGFAVLMSGMDTMNGAVKPLADIPEFTSLFTAFENPVIGMVVGAVFNCSDPEFFCFCRYPAGDVCHRRRNGGSCASGDHGAEYRNLCHGPAFRCRGKQECKKGIPGASLF